MGKRVWGFLTKADTLHSLGTAVIGTAVSKWLLGYWELVASQGWAAVLIVSIALTSIVMIACTGVYWAFSTFRKGRSAYLRPAVDRCPTASDEVKKTGHEQNQDLAKISEHSHQITLLVPESIFVGWINISTRDFRGELLVISFYAFNASGHTIDIASVSGVIGIEFIDCARGGLLLSKALLQSSPRLVNERCDVNSIKTLKSFKFTIEQHITPELMDEISETSNMRRMRLNFDSLNVTACRSDDKNETVRVPLWRRADFRRSSGEGVTTWVEAVPPQEQPLSEI